MIRGGIFFKSDAHLQWFLAIIQNIDAVEDGRIDPEYGAAVYILTADDELLQKSRTYISRHGIRFEHLLKEVDFSEGYRVLVKLAGNLFNPQNVAPAPVDLFILDNENFMVACNALVVRSHRHLFSHFADTYEAKVNVEQPWFPLLPGE